MRMETPRLMIMRFTEDMAERVHLLSLDEDNRRFVPDEVFETAADAQETLAYLIQRYEDQKGPLAYAVLLKDGTLVGHVQLVPMENGAWEIGYHIGREYTGCGYATEAVRAFLPEIMRRLGLDEVHGVCLAENAASVKVLRKCGFVQMFQGEGSYQGRKLEICTFVWRHG